MVSLLKRTYSMPAELEKAELVPIDRFYQYIYTTSDPSNKKEKIKRCVVIIDRHRAVTYRHGKVHSSYYVGKILPIYPLFPPSAIPIFVQVIDISEPADFVLFQTLPDSLLGHNKFLFYPPRIAEPVVGHTYTLVGINTQGGKVLKFGNICEKTIGFFLGTSFGCEGDSGAAIFNSQNSFIGLAVGKKLMKVSHSTTADEFSSHYANAIIMSAKRYADIFRIEDLYVNRSIEEVEYDSDEPGSSNSKKRKLAEATGNSTSTTKQMKFQTLLHLHY